MPAIRPGPVLPGRPGDSDDSDSKRDLRQDESLSATTDTCRAARAAFTLAGRARPWL